MFSNFFEKFTLIGLSLFNFSVFPAMASEKLLVPLEEKSWVSLTYSKIPANKIEFENRQLKVKVHKSAGPIVYKLDSAKKISSFAVSGTFKGSKSLETGSFDEDSILRFGLVAIGKQRLSAPQRWLAADWVKSLFALAPEGVGLDKIYFFNVTNRSDRVGQLREHPKSDLLVEKILWKVDRDGDFELSHQLDKPVEILALWLSIDGDDSASEYETAIRSITLQTLP